MTDHKLNVLFYVGIVLAFMTGIVELVLIYIIVISGQVDLTKSLVTLLNGGVVVKTTQMLVEAWRSQFITKPTSALSHCHSGRLQEIKNNTNEQDRIIDLDSRLITHYLALLESILTDKLGKHHYELSIFTNPVTPEIVAYYDSNYNTSPRSKKARIDDKDFYVKNKYEVVEILRYPSSQTHYIPNTHAIDEEYTFSSTEQKEKVRSTILHCIDIDWPAAIVITCNKEKVLGNDDQFKETFLSIYKAIAADIYLGSLIHRISLSPNINTNENDAV